MFVATSAAIDSGVDFSRMIVYLRSGFLAAESFWFVPALLIVAFAGSYAGRLLLNKIHQQSFRRIVLVLVLFIGLTMLGAFIRHAMLR